MNDLSATDRCVKCGLCLPHCPTFALTGNEADSPRGRISLMQALGEETTAYSPGLFRHLDQCLQCGACEAMCPSKVPFGQLMDNARAVLEPQRKRTLLQKATRRAGLNLVASQQGSALLAGALNGYRRFGLQRLAGHLPLPAAIRRLNALLPTAPQRQALTAHTPGGGTRGKAHLFRGCAGSSFDQQTLDATQQLLQKLGYQVSIPDRQGCCGALHQHNGEPAAAAQLAEINLHAFAGNDDPVIATASACSAQLLAYRELYRGTAAATFTQRVCDILHFLNARHAQELHFRPCAQRVALYMPCTHRNSLGQAQDVMQVLERVPGLEVLLLNPDGGCCGAAGSYMLSQPQLSDALRDKVLDRIADSGAGTLLTTNIGCSLHLQAGLRQRNLTVEVLHPVVLLESLLDDTGIA